MKKIMIIIMNMFIVAIGIYFIYKGTYECNIVYSFIGAILLQIRLKS